MNKVLEDENKRLLLNQSNEIEMKKLLFEYVPQLNWSTDMTAIQLLKQYLSHQTKPSISNVPTTQQQQSLASSTETTLSEYRHEVDKLKNALEMCNLRQSITQYNQSMILPPVDKKQETLDKFNARLNMYRNELSNEIVQLTAEMKRSDDIDFTSHQRLSKLKAFVLRSINDLVPKVTTEFKALIENLSITDLRELDEVIRFESKLNRNNIKLMENIKSYFETITDRIVEDMPLVTNSNVVCLNHIQLLHQCISKFLPVDAISLTSPEQSVDELCRSLEKTLKNIHYRSGAYLQELYNKCVAQPLNLPEDDYNLTEISTESSLSNYFKILINKCSTPSAVEKFTTRSDQNILSTAVAQLQSTQSLVPAPTTITVETVIRYLLLIIQYFHEGRLVSIEIQSQIETLNIRIANLELQVREFRTVITRISEDFDKLFKNEYSDGEPLKLRDIDIRNQYENIKLSFDRVVSRIQSQQQELSAINELQPKQDVEIQRLNEEIENKNRIIFNLENVKVKPEVEVSIKRELEDIVKREVVKQEVPSYENVTNEENELKIKLLENQMYLCKEQVDTLTYSYNKRTEEFNILNSDFSENLTQMNTLRLQNTELTRRIEKFGRQDEIILDNKNLIFQLSTENSRLGSQNSQMSTDIKKCLASKNECETKLVETKTELNEAIEANGTLIAQKQTSIAIIERQAELESQKLQKDITELQTNINTLQDYEIPTLLTKIKELETLNSNLNVRNTELTNMLKRRVIIDESVIFKDINNIITELQSFEKNKPDIAKLNDKERLNALLLIDSTYFKTVTRLIEQIKKLQISRSEIIKPSKRSNLI